MRGLYSDDHTLRGYGATRYLPFLALVLLWSRSPARAQPAPVGSEIRVHTVTAGYQTAPRTSLDIAGNAVVVWQGSGPGSTEADVWAQRYSPSGAPAGAEFRVSSTLTGCQLFPAVSSAADGSFVVAWQSEGQDGSGWGIFARRFDANGTALGPEIAVNTTTASDQQTPRVAHDPGGFVVAWESSGQDGDGWGAYARRFNSAGAPATGEVQVSAFTAGDQRRPAVAVQPTGEIVLAWEAPDGAGPGVFLRRFAAGLTAPGPEVRANTATAGFQARPSLACDGSGNCVVGWEDGGTAIRVRRFTRSLSPLSEQRADSGSAAPRSHPSVASTLRGDFVVLWESAVDDQGGAGVFLRAFDFRELPQGAELRVNTTSPGPQRLPALAASPAGAFLAAWDSDGQDGDGSGVYAQRYALPGFGFYTVMPCRVFDTRSTTPLSSGVARTFQVATVCGIPATARAVSANLTVTGSTAGGSVSVYPADAALPGTSNINFSTAQTRANNAILGLARDGTGAVGARAIVTGSGQVHLILDVNGYFE